jgi:hypothetical protein
MKPDLQFSVLCDDVRREDNGKFMLLGIFEAVALPKYPAVYPRFMVANRWCNGQGNFKQKVRLMGPENQVISEAQETEIALPATMASVTAFTALMNVTLPGPGRYWIETLLDADLIRRFPLMVLQMMPAPGTPPQPPPLS